MRRYRRKWRVSEIPTNAHSERNILEETFDIPSVVGVLFF